MPENTHDLPEIFSAAITISDEEERSKLVDRMANGRPGVREQVYELLKAHESANSFLSAPPQELDLTRAPIQQDAAVTASVLASLGSEFALSPVILRDKDSQEAAEPMLRPNSSEIPSRKPDTKYQVQGEIARGGMGAILQGRDIDLGRSLAIKVLLDDHKNKPEIVQRFIEEAQIGGQLQHPGIAPVYELGQFDDHRPFFTMKLVKGKTLAALLTKRKDKSERGKLLGIFEQICQTMAYAHNRGVIHRDLKPANVMVGAFGEVQVMDWGLAKVLESGGTADEKKARQEQTAHSVIHTYRSDGSGPAMVGTDPANAGETLAGSVMGTPAYMPPEQARGEINRLDERCDVFGLGAILCEILTGRPPYFDDSRAIIYLALEGNLEKAFNNLDECNADAELVDIAKACLEPDASKRIPDAQILAERVSGYLSGVEERLRETELARAKEATRAVEAKKRQRVTLALAATILLALATGAATWTWNQNQIGQRRTEATDKVNEALAEAKLHFGLAESAKLDNRVNELERALASANTANELAQNSAVDGSLKNTTDEFLVRLQQELSDAQQQIALAEADQKLKEELEFIRLSHADGTEVLYTDRGSLMDGNFDSAGTRHKYLTIFEEAGHDFTKQKDSEIVDWIRNSDIQETLLSALDHWAQCLPSRENLQNRYPWTRARSWEEAAQIAKDIRDDNPADSLLWMHYGGTIVKAEGDEAYRSFCQEMLARFEGTHQIFVEERLCKMCLIFPEMVDIKDLPRDWESTLSDSEMSKAPAWWTPWAYNARAFLALRQGKYQKALNDVAKSEAQKPYKVNSVLNYCVQALASHHLGDVETAQSSLANAENLLRETMNLASTYNHDFIFARLLIREAEQLIQPDRPPAEFALDGFPRTIAEAGDASIQSALRIDWFNRRLFDIANSADNNDLRKLIRGALYDGDVTALTTIAKDPKIQDQPPEILTSMVVALRKAEELDLAETVLRRAQRNHPGDFWLNYELGNILLEQEKFEEGIGFSRSALATRPNNASAMWILTSALMKANREQEALEQFRVLLANSDFSAEAFWALGSAMRSYGQWEAAELAIMKAIEQHPENVSYRSFHALIHRDQDNYSKSIEISQQALSTNPDNFVIRFSLAKDLDLIGRETEAIKQARELVELAPKMAAAQNLLGRLLGQTGNYEEAMASFEKAVQLSPENPGFQTNLAIAYRRLGLLDKAKRQETLAIAAYAKSEADLREAVKDDPGSFIAHFNLGNNLRRQGRGVEALESFKRSIEINDKWSTTFYVCGEVLWDLDKKEEALAQYMKALELAPSIFRFQRRVGWALKELKRYQEAIPYYEKALELNPDFNDAKQEITELLQLVEEEEKTDI